MPSPRFGLDGGNSFRVGRETKSFGIGRPGSNADQITQVRKIIEGRAWKIGTADEGAEDS